MRVYDFLIAASCQTLHFLISAPEQKINRDEMSECVREFAGRLETGYKTVFALNELEGFSNKEITDILHSPDAALIKLHRARARL